MASLLGAAEEARLTRSICLFESVTQKRALSLSNAALLSQRHLSHHRVSCIIKFDRKGSCLARRGRRTANVASLAFSMPLTGGPSFKALLSNEPNANDGHLSHSGQIEHTSIDPQASGENVAKVWPHTRPRNAVCLQI